MGDESPEELLYQFQFKFDDPNAEEHHEENFRVLDALRRYNITIDVPDSFYEQPDNLQTYLNSLEESCKFVDDQSVSEFAYRALEGFGPDTPKRGRRKRRNT
jgi:tRNA uridine 5-carbamoylmethylation protein Kti12